MSNNQSLILYIVTFSIAAFLIALGAGHNKRIITAIGLVIPAIIGTLRFNVGTDYHSYAEAYNLLSTMHPSNYLSSYINKLEPGIYIVAKLSHALPDSQLWFWGFFSFATILFIYFSAKRFNIRYIGTFFYLYLLIIFPASFNTVRQMLAVSIFFYAISRIKDKKFFTFVLWICAAALFHKSALVLLALYPFIHIYHNKKITVHNAVMVALSMISVAALSYLLLPTITNIWIFDKYSIYQSSGQEASGRMLILKVALLALLTLLYKHFADVKDYLLLLLFSYLEIITMIIMTKSVVMSRISMYFSIFPLLLLTYVINMWSRYDKYIVWAFICIYGISYFIFVYYILKGSGIFPYNFNGQLSGSQ